jgi:hypothetical protein
MYELDPGVRSTCNDDGGTLLDISRGQIFRLNVTGSRIVALLQQGQGESRIVDSISQEFDIARISAQTDVGDFLRCLERQGLIHQKLERRLL